MKEIKYDKELMDNYIALKCYDLSCEPISEEDRLIIADSLDFQAYCLNVAWNEFLNEIKKSRVCQMINWLASKKKATKADSTANKAIRNIKSQEGKYDRGRKNATKDW